MNSELDNILIFETSVIVDDIELNYPRVRLERITEIKKLDPTLGILKKLVDIFYVEVADRIPEIQNCCQSNDFENLSRIIHRFKSTTYNLGASRARELALAIEKSFSQKVNKLDLRHLIAALEKECAETHKALLTFLNSN